MIRFASLFLAVAVLPACTPGSVTFDAQHSRIQVAADLSGIVSITTLNVRAANSDDSSTHKAAEICKSTGQPADDQNNWGLAEFLLARAGVHELEWRIEPVSESSCNTILSGLFPDLATFLVSLSSDSSYSIQRTPATLSVELGPHPEGLVNDSSKLSLHYDGVIQSSNADEVLEDGMLHRWRGDPSSVRFTLITP